MFITMNRFQVLEGKEAGFISFNLLQGPCIEGISLFSTHTAWKDQQAFESWTQSEAFHKAHTHAGKPTTDIYAGPPKLDRFNAVF